MDLSIASQIAARGQRTRAAIARRGYVGRGMKLWCPTEDQIMRRYYPDYSALQAALPGRTRSAIVSRTKTLSLAPSRPHWTAAEASRLRRLYPTASREEMIAAFPRHEIGAIIHKARSMKLYRRKRSYVSTGVPLIDEIHDRCFHLNIYMPELDKMAGTKRFFQTGQRRLDYRCIGRAVRALGGELTIKWADDGQ